MPKAFNIPDEAAVAAKKAEEIAKAAAKKADQAKIEADKQAAGEEIAELKALAAEQTVEVIGGPLPEPVEPAPFEPLNIEGVISYVKAFNPKPKDLGAALDRMRFRIQSFSTPARNFEAFRQIAPNGAGVLIIEATYRIGVKVRKERVQIAFSKEDFGL